MPQILGSFCGLCTMKEPIHYAFPEVEELQSLRSLGMTVSSAISTQPCKTPRVCEGWYLLVKDCSSITPLKPYSYSSSACSVPVPAMASQEWHLDKARPDIVGNNLISSVYVSWVPCLYCMQCVQAHYRNIVSDACIIMVYYTSSNGVQIKCQSTEYPLMWGS